MKKTYLKHIIQSNGRNDKNIKKKVDKCVGSVEKIITALNERPYGHHTYKAALLMRQGLMLGGMLSNSETWINITEADIAKLTMPDTLLQRRLLSVSGNPNKVVMSLEFGIIPVKFVLMAKTINMLHHILNESIDSTMRQVYEALKCDCCKGDFYSLAQKDIKDVNIQCEEAIIQQYSKSQWKTLVKNAVKACALKYLASQNSQLEKQKI